MKGMQLTAEQMALLIVSILVVLVLISFLLERGLTLPNIFSNLTLG